MEWYTLDSQMRRDQIIEGFNSFIWTERRSAWGDFEIKIPSSKAVKKLLAPGTWIGMKGSYRTMTVETITESVDSAGVNMLDIVGRSIEAWLDDRVAMPAFDDLTLTPTWNMTDTAANIMRAIFTAVCVTGALSANDTIPFYTAGTLLPTGGIIESTDEIPISLQPASLYASLKLVAETYNLGFRLVRDGDNSAIYFEVYTGDDRTSDQNALPAVIFSPGLDNLSNTNQLTSIALVKTVAYVFSQFGTAVVYAPGASADDSGSARRVLFVDASNIGLAPGPDLDAALNQRGQQALAQQKKVYTFDGQVSQIDGYVYGVDYNLGDQVEERDLSGFGSVLIVTEQIFISDEAGERSYPTLTVGEVIVPGSWRAVSPGTERWEDEGTVTWGTYT